MKRIIYAINNYFFDEREARASDYAIYYGTVGAMSFVGVIVWVA